MAAENNGKKGYGCRKQPKGDMTAENNGKVI